VVASSMRNSPLTGVHTGDALVTRLTRSVRADSRVKWSCV
jgi:hypothetical protein